MNANTSSFPSTSAHPSFARLTLLFLSLAIFAGSPARADWKTPLQPGLARTPEISPASAVKPVLDLDFGEYKGEQGLMYSHNGSRVWLFPQAGLIVYKEPKPAIAAVVKPGDVLFEGIVNATPGWGSSRSWMSNENCLLNFRSLTNCALCGTESY